MKNIPSEGEPSENLDDESEFHDAPKTETVFLTDKGFHDAKALNPAEWFAGDRRKDIIVLPSSPVEVSGASKSRDRSFSVESELSTDASSMGSHSSRSPSSDIEGHAHSVSSGGSLQKLYQAPKQPVVAGIDAKDTARELREAPGKLSKEIRGLAAKAELGETSPTGERLYADARRKLKPVDPKTLSKAAQLRR